MRKLLVVARHEFFTNLLRKSFLFATFVLPLLLGVGLVLLSIVAVRTGLRAEQVDALGYVDHAGVLGGLGDEELISGAWGPAVPLRRYPAEAAARQALMQGRIEAFFVVPANYLSSGEITGYVMERLPVLARQRIEQALEQALLERAHQWDQRVERPIVRTTHRTIGVEDVLRTPEFAGVIVPIVFMMLFLWTVFFASNYLVGSLVEEKENRLMEILASSSSPSVLMGGKIIGLGLLGLAQLFVWLSGVALLLRVGTAYFPLLGPTPLPGEQLLLMAALFLGGYLLFAATFSAVGATISATQEGSQLAGFVTLVSLVPTWFIPRLVEQPSSNLAVGLSLFPYTAPISLLLRMAGTTVPWWQTSLTLVLLWGSALAMIWFAGRVMRYGMLRYGQRVGLREIRRALRGE